MSGVKSRDCPLHHGWNLNHVQRRQYCYIVGFLSNATCKKINYIIPKKLVTALCQILCVKLSKPLFTFNTSKNIFFQLMISHIFFALALALVTIHFHYTSDKSRILGRLAQNHI